MRARSCRRLTAALLSAWLVAGPATAEPAYVPQPAVRAPRAVASLLLDVAAAGERRVAVGERGHILHSDDGRDWTQADVPVRSTLTAVSFADARHGWAVGHDAVIVATDDGGRTWRLQHVQPERGTPLLDVLFVDARRGWAVGNFGLFLETADGGTTWTPVAVPLIEQEEPTLHALTRLANGHLLVVGERGQIFRSVDSGLSWKRLRPPDHLTLFGAAPFGPRGVLLCGLRGQAWLREDLERGDWQAIDTGSSQSLYGCATAGRTEALLVGAAATVLRVDLVRRRAAPLRATAAGDLSAALFIAGGWLVVGERGVQRLADGRAP